MAKPAPAAAGIQFETESGFFFVKTTSPECSLERARQEWAECPHTTISAAIYDAGEIIRIVEGRDFDITL